MNLRSKSAALALVTSVAALVSASPAPALADTATFPDKRFDTRHPADVVSVKVSHGDRVVVVVRHRDLSFRGNNSPGSLRIAYDTGARFIGPEFWLRIVYQTDGPIDLHTASGWSRPNRAIPTCRGERVTVSEARDTTAISVPRSCFGNPRRIRVHVRLAPRPGDPRHVDVAPRSRTMGPAVAFSH